MIVRDSRTVHLNKRWYLRFPLSGRHGRKDRGPQHAMNGLVSDIALDNFGDLSKYRIVPQIFFNFRLVTNFGQKIA